MALISGDRIGPYEIAGAIGAGGMGEVYRARDARLKREVAIKALPPDVAFDGDRVARFRREAEALAALNHPHIGGIHDLLESGDRQFLVLELIEGDTLAERVRRGAIPIPEAIDIARQIAEALEAAHARGIVHRDLKPANIKITPSGQVKVLDFGLAKDLGAEPSPAGAASLTHSPTFVGPTKAGVILGTAAYMSPEQARGVPVDAQTDVWALGCVLFEMLTGRQPFSGPTVTDILAAIVRGDPDWSALPADTPASVRALLRRCLQKDPTRRLHHVADARIELEDVQMDSAELTTSARTKLRASERWAWAAAVVLGTIAVGLSIALTLARRPGVAPPEMRVEINTPPSPDPLTLAISPDGQKLVFVAAVDGISRLWVRSFDGTPARALPGTELAGVPFWSPDSRSIGFFADGRLKRIDIAAGLAQTLANAAIGGGGAWSREGIILYAPSIIGVLYQVPAGGGESRVVTRLVEVKQGSHRFPHFLDDGRHFLFYSTGTPEARGIYLGSLDGAEPRRLTDADSMGVLTSSRHLLFVRQGTLFAQPFNRVRLELYGEPSAVADRIAYDANQSAAAITASAAGSFAYRTGGASGQRQLMWFDRAGRKTGTVGAADAAALFNPDFSPDGRFVAVNRTTDNQDVWLVEMARGIFRRFTFDVDADQLPVWSADGSRIVFSSNRKGVFNLYQKPSSGPGNEEPLLESSQNKFAMGFSSDGRFLLYRNTAPNTNWDLWVLPLEGDRKPSPVVQTNFQEMMGEFSPDSRWIAYQSDESGQFEIYVQSFPEAGARTQVSTTGGSQPRWRRDGKEVFYVALDGRLMAAPIAVDAKRQIESGTPVALFMTRTAGGAVPSPQKQQYAVSPDGQRFLINSLTEEAAASPITLVLNWKPPSGTK